METCPCPSGGLHRDIHTQQESSPPERSILFQKRFSCASVIFSTERDLDRERDKVVPSQGNKLRHSSGARFRTTPVLKSRKLSRRTKYGA
jgi:hypothetical protein